MKSNLRLSLSIAAAGLLLSPAISFAQGNLTPPGAPAPMMKTLSQIEPRMPIYAIPTNITVSGSYYLTTNLTGAASSSGITISTNNVTIDLTGFTLAGVPSSYSGISYGGTYSNAVIKNGAVNNWGSSGIDLSYGWHDSLDHVSVSGCGSSGSNSGLLTGQADMVSYCTSMGNAGSGFYTASYNQLDHCSASGNGANGFLLGVQNQITDSGAYYNKNAGIYLNSYGSLVSGCNCSGNGTSGIYLYYGKALVINNISTYNNSAGTPNQAGILVDDTNCRIEGNHMAYNGNAGLAIVSGNTGNVIVRNSASANGTNYILQAGNDVGPVGTATNSTSPWANISN